MIVRILSATFEYMHFKLTRYVNLADFAPYNYKKKLGLTKTREIWFHVMA